MTMTTHDDDERPIIGQVYSDGSNAPAAFNPNSMLPTINDPAAVAAAEQAKMEIQMSCFMALQRPRNVMQARADILAECRRPKFAMVARFKKPQGGKTIEGPSVRLAELAIRCWRNVMARTTVVFEDDDRRRVKVTLTDLESNISYSKEIVVPKTVERKFTNDREIISSRTNSRGETTFTVRATEDEIRAAVAREVSFAVRNEGLRLIPGDIIDEAQEVAIATMNAEDKRDPQAALKRLCDAFAVLGVQPTHLVEYIEHDLTTISPHELDDLRGTYAAMTEGVTWVEIMRAKKGDVEDTVAAQTREKIDRLRAKSEADREAKKAAKAGKPAVKKNEPDPDPTTLPRHELTADERKELGSLLMEAQQLFKNEGDRDAVSLMAEDARLGELRAWVVARRPQAKPADDGKLL